MVFFPWADVSRRAVKVTKSTGLDHPIMAPISKSEETNDRERYFFNATYTSARVVSTTTTKSASRCDTSDVCVPSTSSNTG